MASNNSQGVRRNVAENTPFFQRFRSDELGATKVVTAAAIAGQKGDPVKLLDLTAPDGMAAPMLISLRTEYSANQADVSNTLSPVQAIVNTTNAIPIAVTTGVAHGFFTGQSATVTGVRGNVAANISTTITVTGPTTFTLDGSNGTVVPGVNGPYTAGGQVVVTSLGGTGTGAPQIGSPIVGILQWGVGGGQNQVEFDIPAPRFPALIFPATPPNQPMNNIGNGMQIYVSTSHVSLYVRHDGNIAPLTNPLDHVGSTLPVKVIGFVSPGEGSGRPPVERMIFCAGGLLPGPPAATPLIPGGVVVVTLPPFAKVLRVQRLPIGTPVRVTAANNFGVTYREVQIPVNSEGPVNVDGFAQEIRIQNLAAVNIDFMQAVFDVTPS